MLHAAYLMPLLPAGRLRACSSPSAAASATRWPGWVGTVAVAGAFVVAVRRLRRAASSCAPAHRRSSPRTTSPGPRSAACRCTSGILVDPLSMTMCLFVTGVSTLIHLYSIGYMKGDRDYSKFFIYLNLFVFSMLLLVLANNLLLTFVGLGGRGGLLLLARRLLVRAGVGRLGRQEGVHLQPDRRRRLPGRHLPHLLEDGHRSTTWRRSSRSLAPARRRHGHGRRAAALPGRHRQVGPDPAVQLAARRHGGPDAGLGPHPRRHHGDGRGLPAVPDEPAPRTSRPTARWSIAIIGGVTAFVAATIACAQQDIKKVLAFSTVSQIGYMVLAVGSGAYVAAIFLMVPTPSSRACSSSGAGLGHPRPRRRAGPQAHGRAAPLHDVDRRSPSSSAGWPSPASRRSRASGPRATCSTTSSPTTSPPVGVGRGHRRAHRVLHDPARSPRLQRRGRAGDKPGPERRAGAAHARTSRPGSCGSRWSSWPSSPSSPGCSTCPGCTPTDLDELARPGLRRHASTTTTWQAAPQWALAIVDIAAAFIGLIVAYWLWRGATSTSPRSSRRSSSGSGTGTTSTTPSSAGPASAWPRSAPGWSTPASSTAR